jgi:hypothetical protein
MTLTKFIALHNYCMLYGRFLVASTARLDSECFVGWILCSAAVMAVLVFLGSLFGDLTESMIKRDAGVKDSGKLIPGHGMSYFNLFSQFALEAALSLVFLVLHLPAAVLIYH